MPSPDGSNAEVGFDRCAPNRFAAERWRDAVTRRFQTDSVSNRIGSEPIRFHADSVDLNGGVTLPPPPPYSSSGSNSSGSDVPWVVGDADRAAPSRGAVFGHVLWRAFVLSVGGGIAVGVLFVLTLLVFGESFGELDSTDGWATALVLAVIFGALFGVLLGVPAACILAVVAAAVLVPFRGPRATRTVMRACGIACVVVFFGVLSGGNDRVWWVLGAGGVVGAARFSPWLVNWYVRRMLPAGA
jgi:hypothetical protein